MTGEVLVLNQNYEPLNITSLRRAMALLHLGKAEIVEAEERLIRSARWSTQAPSVVRLAYYVKRPYPQLRVTRRGVFARDQHQCQYCGITNVPMTVDHVLPTSRGGGNSWQNLVTCCVPCNNRKGDRTPEEAYMPLKCEPYRPKFTPYISFPKFMSAVRHNRWGFYLRPFAGALEMEAAGD